ncbi:hypothetical protein N7481_010090 [Penicillium waksmanii]|uniref:uncharacterized protein n=1 Tax=Penicillium waksmanii TaxID=69791 RepID=UPI0025487C03|nr:uncharacterized protein N7481_010090 [Penicillium waksmanii]KAJ5976383.1 hypothetical protein N7481_010090 [Penicillium waksmanii]
MKFHWSPICIAGAIASALPYASSHELHLPYLPTLEPENPVETYMPAKLTIIQSIKWAIQNGSLYANNDQVFPPAMSMQLHAPLYETHRNIPIEQEDIQVSYSVKARFIPAGDNGSKNKILRIHVELLDREGRPVTPHSVSLDLLDHPDGTHRITRIRLDSPRGSRRPRPWQMKFWQSQVNTLFNQNNKPGLSASDQSTEPKAKPTHSQEATKLTSEKAPESTPILSKPETESESQNQVGYIFSPYWSPSTYIAPSDGRGHRGHRRPHGHHQNDSFMRLVRPVILPAMLGVGAGLIACLVGFCVGHVIMSVSVRLGLCKKRSDRRLSSRSIPACLEEGILSEKAQLMVPEIHLTQPDV